MASVSERVGDLDESQIIDRIQRFLCGTVHTEVGVGDDAAVVRAPDGRVVVSTDALVEGHHFRREWSSARDVGWRAGTQNLADIVAMGASPTSMVVALGVPRDTPVQWVMDFYDGLSQVCATVGAEIVGGDLTAAPVIMVAVTVHGNLGGQPPILRSGASVGDVVAHTGSCGWSAAGFALLQHGGDLRGDAPGDPMAVVERALAAFRAPTSPFVHGLAAQHGHARAMLDVSDGVLRDVGRIATASGVGVNLDDPLTWYDPQPLMQVAAVVDEDDPAYVVRQWMLTGGEDHGFIAVFPPDVALPDGWTAIGTVVPPPLTPSGPCGGAVHRVRVRGVETGEMGSGWDHFSGSSGTAAT